MLWPREEAHLPPAAPAPRSREALPAPARRVSSGDCASASGPSVGLEGFDPGHRRALMQPTMGRSVARR